RRGIRLCVCDRDRYPPALGGGGDDPGTRLEPGLTDASGGLVYEPPDRRVDEPFEQVLEPLAVDRVEALVGPPGGAHPPGDQRDVADQLEDGPDPRRVGERRLEPGGLDLCQPGLTAARPAHRPFRRRQPPAELPPATATADDQRSRQPGPCRE